MSIVFGIIEGFYGKPWSWEDRLGYAKFLRENKLDFYIYAPKGDRYLRENWETPFPRERLSKLITLGNALHEKGINWGIGFSPFNAYKSFNEDTKNKLQKKLEEISKLNPEILALLFDDMRGDIEEIAETQVKITHFVASMVLNRSSIKRFLFCPTYYTFDPILEKIFGKAPEGYLKYMGDNLDQRIDIIWTGPMVRSNFITMEHLREVGKILRRKPFIWDNYIANDGEKHENHIYLKPITGRKPEIIEFISGYMINPMNQAELSKIPILTAVERFNAKGKYHPELSLRRAIEKICGPKHAPMVEKYREYLLKGRDTIPFSLRQEMLNEISPIKENWAKEIVNWLRE